MAETGAGVHGRGTGPTLAAVTITGPKAAATPNQGMTDMDYGKSGAAKTGKHAPRHKEHNAKGSDKNPFGKQPSKAELLKRMKEAAAKKS
ncbi:hypothetical protein QKW60_11230 [Defluviimonas aestuarii]|uniref:hypothetical protein n=1 Tax=Albidovulum aestuarii TaxID=1130726 RepID=UPI00249B883D|nr:hypothetical protein [Defluviimonas aestuarii]MDI3336984.1 hypothetical protein [Defluviimonas aestuarii]